MNTKLTTITTQYSKFSDNQVLTKGQLNQFLEYFEDQDHLSRIGLSGVGIVCGFGLTYDGSKKEIYITQGYGVTTDGDLVALVEPKKAIEGQATNQGLQLVKDAIKTYTHYRNFDDSNAIYAPFFNGEEQIELLEIFPGEDIDLTNTTYKHLNTLSPAILDDKVALLYLENYPKQGDLCTALDCDNQGIEQVARLRVLLVSSDDAKTITGYDPIYNEHDWHEYYLALPEIAVRRDILTEANTKDYIRLKQHYYKLIKDNETLADLSLGLDMILQKFGRASISSNISSLFDISPSAVPIDFQYHYDVLKDLVDTYTEIKGLLLHLNVHCCPSIGSFPKHLLLGRLKESQPHYKSLRHRFYKSPIVGHENVNLKRVHSLLKRIEELADSYLKVEKGEDIKITPSLLQGMLGTKAIPFYYNLNQAFLKYWSHDKFQNFIQNSNLSYHTTHLSPSLSIQEPLLFDIDDYNFLRIEGIQGKSYRDALDQVLTLKKEYGLSFDVKVLSLNPTTKDIDLGEYRCEFEDLGVLLKAWTTEQECILASMANFFSGFTTDKVGENIKEIEYTQGRKIFDRETINTDIDVSADVNRDVNTNVTIDVVSDVSVRGDFSINPQRILSTSKQINVAKQIQLPYTKNVIDQNLTVEEKTIGRYMKEAFDENKEGSVNDIKNAAKSKIEELLSTDEWVAQPDIRDFVYNDVVDLLSVTYILSERIPQSIAEINEDKIDTYELTLEEVCQLVKRLKVTYQTIDLEDTLKDILGLLINQLSFVCCSGEKLSILLNEIETRKQEIIKQLRLSEFVKKHPGLRHYAGVPIGGTFVMAYLTEDAEDKVAYQPVRLELNFAEQPKVQDTIIEEPTHEEIIDRIDDRTIVNKRTINDRAEIPINSNIGILKLWDDRISTEFIFLNELSREHKIFRNKIVLIGETLDRTVSNLADFFNNIWRIAGLSNKCKATAKGTRLIIDILDQKIRKEENYIQFVDPAIIKTNEKIFFNENEIITRNLTAKNTVIADFALPYMCCSDCAPINFIVPKEPVSLSLPTPFICLDDSTTPIPFTVSPTDGEVKAIVEGEISGGVTQNEEGAYLFDATLLDPSLYGTAIRFTVNDEETIAVITVYQNPQPIVNVLEEDFIYNDAKTEVEAFFEVTGIGINANSLFTWNFGDGTPIVQERPNSDGIVSHVYTLPITPDNTVSPRLTVTNELCSNDAPIDDITFDDPVINLTINDFPRCVDPNDDGRELRIPFNVQPQNATVTVNGEIDGVSIDVDIDTEQSGVIVINPILFSAYKTPITFSVNGEVQESPVVIILNKNDFADFTCEPENTSVPEGTESVLITFEVTGLTDEQKEELGFNWNFGDGEESREADITHQYDISNLESGIHTFAVVLTIEGGPCDVVIITKDVAITIAEPNIPFSLNDNEICFEAGTNGLATTYTLSPDVPILVDGDATGISINRTAKTIRLTSAFTRFNTPIQFTINGEINTSETLIVRRKPVNIDFSWSPTSVQWVDGQEEITITFTATNYDTNLYPGTTLTWNFEGGPKVTEESPSIPFTLTREQIESSTFSVNAVLTVSGNGCDDFTTEVTQVVVLLTTEEPANCNDIVDMEIRADDATIKNDPTPDGDIGNFIVTPTKQAYATVISEISKYIAGDNNGQLDGMLSTTIEETANRLLQESKPDAIQLFTKYLKVQIRLIIHVLHCQKDLTEEDIAALNPIMDAIKTALERLQNTQFDVGDPEPNKLEGTLREFLMKCIENEELPEYTRLRIESFLELIAPVG